MMRQMVRKFWIDGVLKSSLHNEILIRLNLEECPEAVDNRPWDLILQKPGQPEYSLPKDASIVDVYNQMSQQLLILGEPGSGKTTMLLELESALLKGAEADPTQPTPVVFTLSSWAEKRLPLVDWLVEELRTKYNVPKRVAQSWLENDELLLLLDGLDEVQLNNRIACVEAINTFRQEHLIPLVVSSRTTEYENLTTQLKLQGAVLVQPLTVNQIDDYFGTIGPELSAVREAFQQNIELQDLATTPLMLNIMGLAYQGASTIELPAIGSPQTHRQHC
ncbi:MAG: NACHT domain-containing protein [Chloroflexota bacterium]